jgi:hypothetical protein
MGFYCEDVDSVVAKAEQAGATVREPAQTFVTGDSLDPRSSIHSANAGR